MTGSPEDVRVEVRGLRAFGPHGVTAAEREVGCWIALDIGVTVRRCHAVATDEVSETVDYGGLARTATEIVRDRSCRTLERLGGLIADAIAADFGVEDMTVRVAKPSPPFGEPVEDVAVTIARGEG